jgi:D-aspartate ligase
MDAGTPIVVLKCARAPFHHGGLAIARSAGRLGIPVYGLHEGRFAPAGASRYDRGGGRHLGDAPPERWVQALLELGARLGRAVLVPVDDTATVLVADHRETLRARYLFPDQSPELIRTLSDKAEMWRLCERLGVDAPATVFPESAADVRRHAQTAPFPIVVKQIAAWYESRDPDAHNVAIVDTPAALSDAYARMESPARPNVMLQEYIPGGSDSIWMFNGYFDAGSECRIAFTGPKLRQRGPRTGPTTLGVCQSSPAVAETTRQLMKAVGYRGILDIGYRYDARDGRYKLLDVNPRIGGTFRLFVGEGGMDVLRALYLDLTGQPVPATRAIEGRRWIDEPHDLLAALQLRAEGELGFHAWARSLRGVREGAWFARDDPLPFVVMTARMGAEVPRWLRRTARVRRERTELSKPYPESPTASSADGRAGDHVRQPLGTAEPT